MLAFSKFNEDPMARFGTVMIDPQRIESCTISERKMAGGAVANTLEIVMQSGVTHLVYGSMSDYLKIEDLISKNRETLKEEAIERLADYAHNAWASWMKYMFNRGAIAEAIGWTMPQELYQRWQRQMLTPYSDLPESEKESDRAEARKILDTISCR